MPTPAEYAAIADEAVIIIGSLDPAQFQTAYDAMILQTTVQDRTTIPTTEIFNIVLDNQSEWETMSDTDRQIVRDILVIYATEGIPTQSGDPARATLINKLGATTVAAVGAVIPENVPTWPGLTTGQVSDALNGRERGDW